MQVSIAMTEAEFQQVFAKTLSSIEQQLDELDLALDGEREAETLQFCFANSLKWVITPQPPLKQLWFATHQQGYHFDWQDGQWIDNRSGQAFFVLLNELLSQQLGVEVRLVP